MTSALPAPFNDDDSDSSSGEPYQNPFESPIVNPSNNNGGGGGGGLPTSPQTDSEEEIQQLQAAYNQEMDAVDNEAMRSLESPPMFSVAPPVQQPPPQNLNNNNNIYNKSRSPPPKPLPAGPMNGNFSNSNHNNYHSSPPPPSRLPPSVHSDTAIQIPPSAASNNNNNGMPRQISDGSSHSGGYNGIGMMPNNPSPASPQMSVTDGTPEPFIPPPPQSPTQQDFIFGNKPSTPSLHRNGPMPPPSANSNVAPYGQNMVRPSAPSQPQIVPKRMRSGNATDPILNGGGGGNNNNKNSMELGINKTDHEVKSDTIDNVSFTDILRQVDVGVEMTDRLKEVIRKFCKHQQMGADKLQEIYGKLPSTYQDTDGMKEFADLCALVHTLILETVSAQKRFADFLHKDVVPKMDTYIKEKQQQIQHLKRDNQQAEMKLKNSINAMNKASNSAKSSALKAKQMATAATSKHKNYNKNAKKKGGMGLGGVFKKLQNNPNADLPEDEQAYLKAQTMQKNYEASVMAANYEQDTYNEIQARFKRDCQKLEQQRLQYCHGKIQQFINGHRSYFNNETIMVLQTRILSSLDALDGQREFDQYLGRIIEANKKKGIKSMGTNKKKFEAKKYDYQNVFHSLQDSMDITNKLAPHAKLPLMLTSLCNKVRELNGFDTEGIFRKSAMATEIDKQKNKLSQNDYALHTKDPHVAACLLKDWLRGLKDSLIPQTHYDMAITMAKKNEIKQESLEVFLSQLPEVNRETIKYLVKFLKELIDDSHVGNTKMNLENVAIVFAPTILKCPSTDPKALLANSRFEKSFTIALIKELEPY